MPTLLLPTRSLPSGPALAEASRGKGWGVWVLDEGPAIEPDDKLVFYGGSDVALATAARFGLALIEPPLDLLACIPQKFSQRTVHFARFRDLHRLKQRTFIKPADPCNKSFDAGIYTDIRDIRAPHGIDADTPILLAEPVEWLAEYRFFVLENEVVAGSPYLSFGRPNWKPYDRGGKDAQASPKARSLCDSLLKQTTVALPPAFVIDIGLIEDRGWAVVEFNPIWCAGLLGADPARVLDAMSRVCQRSGSVSDGDQRWVRRGQVKQAFLDKR